MEILKESTQTSKSYVSTVFEVIYIQLNLITGVTLILRN